MATTQLTYDYVLESVFGTYLLDPEALKLRLADLDTAIRITAEGLNFSLPELYNFVGLETKGGNKQSYLSFRRCIYGQQTQVMLHTLGGEVVIAQNHQHVNKTIYQLKALS